MRAAGAVTMAQWKAVRGSLPHRTTLDEASAARRRSILRGRTRATRWLWIGAGFVLVAVGAVGVWIPFTFHVLGLLVVVGLILVLRNSRTWRRRFVRFQHRHPRWGVPIRRLLRTPPDILPVFWHEVLRTERWVIPRGRRRLGRWRRRVFRFRRRSGAGLGTSP